MIIMKNSMLIYSHLPLSEKKISTGTKLACIAVRYMVTAALYCIYWVHLHLTCYMYINVHR